MGFFVKLAAKPRSMKTFRLLTALALVLVANTSNRALAQCTETLDLTTTLAASQSETGSIFLAGDLSGVTVNLNYTGEGSSYPADMMVYIYAPDGSCVVFGGWNVDPVGGCTDLGTGFGDSVWPDTWNTGLSGNYTATIDVSAGALSGSGDWIVEVQNAWATGNTVTYDLEFTFDGPCAGECPDPLACNYVPEDQQTNPLLDICEYAEDLFGEGYDCDGVCLNDEDGDGICDETDDCFGSYDECGNCGGTDTSGCTDEMSCNYDPNASCDDGGCLYLDACGDCGGNGVIGCIDNTACNFDPNATCDSGGCLTFDECGVCGGSGYLGCTDDTACNYDEGASCDDGSCLYSDAIGVCGGSCAADEDGDGLCDACTDPEGYWIDIETVAEHTEGELMGMTTYRLYAVLDNPSDYLFAVTGGGLAPLEINSTSGTWYNHPDLAAWNPSGLDTSMLAMDPNLAFDSFMTIGSENSDGGPFPFSIWSGGDPRPEFQPGGGANVGMGNGTMQLTFPGLDEVDTHPAFAGDDLRVLGMQITTEGDVYGQFNVTVYPGGQTSNPIINFVEFDSGSSCFDLDPCVGEYDECGVCAGPGAIYECGCSGPEEGFCDCDGNMLDALGVCGGSCEADVDMDGVCDVDEIPGCDDAGACNYDEAATDNDGSCVYAEQYYDCTGTCLMDTDGDGVCDELEIVGCLDEMACNYDPTATDDSGMCTYPEEFLDCNGDCMNDINDNGICDELEAFGCVDELACNYDAEAAVDDGSCVYAEEYYNCDGECLNDADGDGVCDELEIVGCMQLEACNWNEDATEPDDSCEFPGDACDDGDDTTINDVITADCDCVGEVDRVDEFTQWGIALFPTPVQDVMHLQFRGEAHGVASLVIQNAAGQIIRTDQIQGDATVDVSTLSGGVYFVSVEGAWGAATRRVVLTGGR